MSLDSELWGRVEKITNCPYGSWDRDLAVALLDLRREVEALKAKLEGGK